MVDALNRPNVSTNRSGPKALALGSVAVWTLIARRVLPEPGLDVLVSRGLPVSASSGN